MAVSPVDLKIEPISRFTLDDDKAQKLLFHKHVTHIYFEVPIDADAGLRIGMGKQDLDAGNDTLDNNYLLVEPGQQRTLAVSLLAAVISASDGLAPSAYFWISGDGQGTEAAAMALTEKLRT